jgi:hypothetical protein
MALASVVSFFLLVTVWVLWRTVTSELLLFRKTQILDLCTVLASRCRSV